MVKTLMKQLSFCVSVSNDFQKHFALTLFFLKLYIVGMDSLTWLLQANDKANIEN